ncbi:ribonuclease H, partial [Trifolium pratense]
MSVAFWARVILYVFGKRNDWLETLSQEEGAEKAALEQLLFGLNLYLDREDRWRWTLTGSGIFSVKSAYIFLHSRSAPIHLASDLTYALRKLWKNDVPSKVGVFGWRLLLEKLPTRAALASK